MKKNKLKQTKNMSEDAKEIQTLIIITLVIIAITVGLYFITEASLNKKKSDDVPNVAEINYNIATIGTMFTRPYKEYYILAYEGKEEDAQRYESIFNSYLDKEDAKKIYQVDLSMKVNNQYLNEKSNKKPTKTSEVAIDKAALILIKDGKVSKYYETLKDIEKALK